MKQALIKSLAGHLGLIVLSWGLWYWGSSISASKLHGYPKTINAALVVRPAGQKSHYQPPPTAPPKIKVSKSPAPEILPPKPNRSKTEPSTAPQTPANLSERETSEVPPATSMSIDILEFPFPQYLALLQYRVERQWRPPFTGTEQLNSTVFFRIDRNGKLLETLLEKSSGDFAFDQAALRAVYNAAPLPTLPVEAALASLGVHFEFVGRP